MNLVICHSLMKNRIVYIFQNKECWTLDGESPVAESITSLHSDPSNMGHVESRVNQWIKSAKLWPFDLSCWMRGFKKRRLITYLTRIKPCLICATSLLRRGELDVHHPLFERMFTHYLNVSCFLFSTTFSSFFPWRRTTKSKSSHTMGSNYSKCSSRLRGCLSSNPNIDYETHLCYSSLQSRARTLVTTSNFGRIFYAYLKYKVINPIICINLQNVPIMIRR